MSDIRVYIRADRTLAKLGSLAPTTQRNLIKFMTAFAVRLQEQIKINILTLFNSTGPLYRSVGVSRRDTTVTAYTEGVPYARILEEGGRTSPHTIVPHTATVLAFEGPAGLVFAKKVNHPGSVFPARPYASLALAQLRGEFEDGIREVVAETEGEL